VYGKTAVSNTLSFRRHDCWSAHDSMCRWTDKTKTLCTRCRSRAKQLHKNAWNATGLGHIATIVYALLLFEKHPSFAQSQTVSSIATPRFAM
jgi:hypothetical protein